MTVSADVTASAAVKTQFLVGVSDNFEVKLDGKPVVRGGSGSRKPGTPDQQSIDVTLTPGPHTLTITLKPKLDTATIYARFLDPERKLQYPEANGRK